VSVYGTGFACSADGRIVAIGDTSGVEIFSIVTGKSLHKMEAHKSAQTVGLTFSADGKVLVTAGSDQDHSLRFWDACTGKPIRQATLVRANEFDSYQPTLGFSPSGKVLAVGGSNLGLQLWDAVKGVMGTKLNPSETFAFSPDGRLLATAGESAAVQLWEVATGKPIAELRGHTGGIVGLLFAPNGQMLASGATDHTTLLWDVRVPRLFASAGKRLEPDAGERLRAWKDLAGEDAHVAYQALARLAADPAESVALVGQRLKPVQAPPARQVEQWVQGLGDRKFDVRERATVQLRRLGRVAEPALRHAVEASPSLEALRRLERLLAELGNDELGLSGERLRKHRAVQLLEIIGTPAARRVLERLAGGVERAAETEMARAALRRFPKPPRP
jgi:hypothetical protein